jgi:hypothetical protein
MTTAAQPKILEYTVEIDCRGRRMRGGLQLPRGPVPDRSDDPCRSERAVEDRLENERRRGLPVGARDAHEQKRACGVAEEELRGGSGGRGGICDDDRGEQARDGTVHDESGGTARFGVGDETVAVHRATLHGDEEIPGSKAAGIGRNAGDLDIGEREPLPDIERRDQRGKLHDVPPVAWATPAILSFGVGGVHVSLTVLLLAAMRPGAGS